MTKKQKTNNENEAILEGLIYVSNAVHVLILNYREGETLAHVAREAKRLSDLLALISEDAQELSDSLADK